MVQIADKRPYQQRVIDAAVEADGRGVIIAPTGSGKTYMAFKILEHFEYDRLLILAPRYSAMITWVETIKKFGLVSMDDVAVVEKWPAKKRAKLWGKDEKKRPKIVIMTYAAAAIDAEQIFDKHSGVSYIFGDESHKLTNKKTKRYKAVRKLVRGKRKLFLSATPLRKGPQNFWTCLHMLSPSVFSSYWEFVNKYCVVEDDGYGKVIVGAKKSTLKDLRARLRNFVFEVKPSEVEGYVPKSIRKDMHIKLVPKIRRIYDDLRTNNLTTLPGGEVLICQNEVSRDIRCRQLLMCPAILDEALGVGQGIEEIYDHAISNDKHIVIFSEFTDCFVHWKKFLRSNGVRNIYTLQGGMSISDTQIIIDQYSRHQGEDKMSVLLCSLHYAESFDLLSPSTGYFLGYNWNQNVNWQAEGRLTRGRKTHCNFFYIVHENTIDGRIKDTLNINVKRTAPIMNTRKLSGGKGISKVQVQVKA